MKRLLIAVYMLMMFGLSPLVVQAEGESVITTDVNNDVTAETKDISEITDVTINFTKGNLYRYRGIEIEPEVSSITFVDEKGVKQELSEGFEVKYYEDSNNIELGYANVWVSIDGYEGEVKVENAFEIVVSRPRNVEVAAKKNKIVLRWDEVCGSYGYEIYKSTKKDTRGELYYTVSTGEVTSFSDESVQAGERYYYTLRAFRELDGIRHYSEYTKQHGEFAKLDAPENVDASRWTYNTIDLTWKKVKNSEGYRIYRSTSENGEYKRVTTVTNANTVEYRDEVPTCGKKYYYKVAAYMMIDGEKQNGIYSKAVWARTAPKKIRILDKSVSKSQSITLKWEKSNGAKGYEIYRSTKKNGEYKKVKTVESADTLSWTNSKLDDKTTYFYKIRPYTVSNDEKIYGLYSEAFEKILIPKEIEEITEYTYVSYRSGGNSPSGWDCSGFTQWVYKNIYNKEIPRSSREQAKIGKSIDKNDMAKWKPGDILVYAAGGSVNHVGLYLGNGKMMHALNTTYDTVIQDVGYYEAWDSRNNLKSVRRCL